LENSVFPEPAALEFNTFQADGSSVLGDRLVLLGAKHVSK